MQINIERVLADIETITQFGRSEANGCNRHSYSEADESARAYLLEEFRKLALHISTDGVGNIRATYPGQKPESSVMCGSHIDTVSDGGKYDGLLGVLLTLEALRVIKENDIRLASSIDLILFAEEEGSNFGVTMLGSKVMTGDLTAPDLKKLHNDAGESAYEVIRSSGYDVEHLQDTRFNLDSVKAMLEMHIEQGAVLEFEQKQLGIVEAIVGMQTLRIRMEGVANHAGTTPMHLRNDPMCGVAELILFIESSLHAIPDTTSVATVGKVHCEPNMPNVIPSMVEIFVDIRDVDNEKVQDIVNKIEHQLSEIGHRRKLQYSCTTVGKSESARLDPGVVNLLATLAKKWKENFMRMNSGAVHDAALISKHVPTGMIFLPSVKGLSHCPQEDTKQEDIERGGNFLLAALVELCSDPMKTRTTN